MFGGWHPNISAHDACGGPPGTWGYQVCALFCGPMVYVQCSPWAARRRLFLMGAQCTDHWRLRLPCLTDARVLFSSLSAPPSIALVLAPLALLECRQAMLLSLPQPPFLCWDLSIGTSLPPQVSESVPAAVLLAIFHPLPTSVLKEPLLEGASQHPPVRDRFLLCRIFVRVGFLFRCGLGMGDA